MIKPLHKRRHVRSIKINDANALHVFPLRLKALTGLTISRCFPRYWPNPFVSNKMQARPPHKNKRLNTSDFPHVQFLAKGGVVHYDGAIVDRVSINPTQSEGANGCAAKTWDNG
jgi:hypothetical protein